MYDYWEDIENIELYSELENYKPGIHLAITDNNYIVEKEHKGSQVKVYSTSKSRENVTGILKKEIANRKGFINLKGHYNMSKWEKNGDFFSLIQIAFSNIEIN